MKLSKLLCYVGSHKYEKFMGPKNIGYGKFKQHFKCSVCGKIKIRES